MKPSIESFTAQESDLSLRLDKVLTQRYPEKSRQYFQKLFEDGAVFVNGAPVKASAKLKAGDMVEVRFPEMKELDLEPVDMNLDIVFEDEDIIVVNKPPGLVVHPGEGGTHQNDSLVNGLLYHCKGSLSGINGVLRPGIVHRLDKNTSGLMVVAKNDTAHRGLAEQFHDKKVEKVYFALLAGMLEPKEGSIDAPIGRDPIHRKKMAVVDEHQGRTALTHYQVVEYVGDFTYVKVQLVTGRTHQIRVHFASIGFPLCGDELYGKTKVNRKFAEFGLKRQFLHAGYLSFTHPRTQKKVEFEAPLPSDLSLALERLKND
ncbi:RluA family pseudouridine synthase [Candidatus Peregrinibacteria bacterium]|nr:RluA family pseudouridine synthase [Candidatus Peregrinibacteria bacterium]